ncbi:MAG: hypothetical protein HYV27_23300 [Candidatus Hydrogenedentes bacterium]|nr:hypothetical protein [Candidatus Hydrogenedentota bacterium]
MNTNRTYASRGWASAAVLLLVSAAPAAAYANADRSAAAQAPCTSCHASEVAAAETAYAAPAPENGEAAAQTQNAPGVMLLDVLSKFYGGVLFNHKIHAEMGAMNGGCATCHHYSPENTTPACRACHEITPNGERLNQPGLRGAYHRQCMACHRDWSGETDCERCHLPAGAAFPQNIPLESTDIVGMNHPPLIAPETVLYNVPDASDTQVTFHHADHAEVFGLLAITGHDLFIPILTYVFGEAHLNGPAAIVSTHRLTPEFYGLPADAELLEERACTEAVHELGHTAGLLHCSDYSCAMHASHAPEEIDLKEADFCTACKQYLFTANGQTLR